MLLLFVAACGFLAAEAIVCTPDMCTGTCPDNSDCKGTVVPKGGFCGCCDSCVNLLGENEKCSFSFLLGVPATHECGPGLHCSLSSLTCEKIDKRQVAVGPCALKLKQLQTGTPLLGAQIPVCNQDGSYKSVQCQGSVCYCVDSAGVEIAGYRTSIGATDFPTKNCRITSGEAVQLTHAIDNTSGQLEVALCDITYLPQWTNINVSNNKLFVGGTRSQITDGYYSVCSLNDEVFKPLGAELKMNDSNGTVVLINNGRNTLRLGRPLARTLGMSPDEIKPTTTVTGTKLPDLVPYRELFIHLSQIESLNIVDQNRTYWMYRNQLEPKKTTTEKEE